MNERERILKMIEDGKITAKEGLELLNALGETPVFESSNKQEKQKRKYTVLKFRIIVEEENIDLNVNIPLSVVKVFTNVADEFDKLIPKEAKETMKKNGVDLDGINFLKIIKAIESGEVKDPHIVDMDISDKNKGLVKIKIYLD